MIGVSAVRGDELREGDDSRRSLFSRTPAFMVDSSESETLELRTRFFGVDSGRTFFDERVRLDLIGVIAFVDLTAGSESLVGVSSAESSSMLGTTFRFREAGVSGSRVAVFFGVEVRTLSFLISVLVVDFDTRVKLLMFDDACCLPAGVFGLVKLAFRRCCLTAGPAMTNYVLMVVANVYFSSSFP